MGISFAFSCAVQLIKINKSSMGVILLMIFFFKSRLN
jgi:hypothetical protein